jgi:hypothetical protein
VLTDRSVLRRNALILVGLGFLWNFFEARAAFWSSVSAGSVALFTFGLEQHCRDFFWRSSYLEVESER